MKHILVDKETHKMAKTQASKDGVSLKEYIKRLVWARE